MSLKLSLKILYSDQMYLKKSNITFLYLPTGSTKFRSWNCTKYNFGFFL